MVTFNDLLNVASLNTLSVAAGERGLSKKIRAVSVMDSPDSYKWLKGGEFILTSAFLYGNDPKMVEYVFEHLVAAECAGFGIKKDRFLSEIPDIIIQRANKLRFPIIEIPYNFGWSDIFAEFYRLSYESDKQDAEFDHAIPAVNVPGLVYENTKIYEELLSALVSGHNINRYLSAVHEFTGAGGYFTAIVSAADPVLFCGSLIEHTKSARLMRLGACLSFVHYDNKDTATILFSYHPASEEVPVHEWQYLLFEDMENRLPMGYISAGRLYKDPRDIETSYNEAKEAMLIGKSIYAGKRKFLYYSLSFLCVLHRNAPDLVDTSLIEALAKDRALARIEAFETLEAYIEHGSSAKTAHALHIHDNSLRYRLQRISDFYHFDITETANILVLAVQLAFWKLNKN